MNEDTNYYKSRKSGMSGGDTFFAFMTGLVLGSVAALMTSQHNRDKVKKTLENVKEKGSRLLSDTTRKAEEATESISKNAKNVADDAHDKIAEFANIAEQKAQEAKRTAAQSHRPGRGLNGS